MSEAEALAILGLQPGAPEADIGEAHRRLVQKFIRIGVDHTTLPHKLIVPERFCSGTRSNSLQRHASQGGVITASTGIELAQSVLSKRRTRGSCSCLFCNRPSEWDQVSPPRQLPWS